MKKFKVRSKTDARRKYVVTRKPSGRGFSWMCSCPHWIFRRARCKHIESVA